MINAISGGQWPGRHFRCIVRKGNAILERGSMSNIIIIKGDIHKLKLHLKIVFFVAIYCFFFSCRKKKKNWNAGDRDKGDGFLLQGSTIPEGRKKEGILISRKPVKLETKCYKYCVTIVRR